MNYKDKEKASRKHVDTLCVTCRKACGKCSWSETLTPVPGWTAEETTTSYGLSSYLVTACPEYVRAGRFRDEVKPSDLDTEGCHALVTAIVKTAAEDYVDIPEQRSQITYFFRSSLFANLSLADPEYIIKTLRARAKQRDREKAQKLLRLRGGAYE